MLACMRVVKAIAIIVGISALYHCLFFLGGAFTGAGHGSYFFIELIAAPFFGAGIFASIGMIAFWPLESVLLALHRFLACRIAAAVGIVTHYIGAVSVCVHTTWDRDLGKAWAYFPGLVAGFFAAYIGSQILMWVLILRRQNDR